MSTAELATSYLEAIEREIAKEILNPLETVADTSEAILSESATTPFSAMSSDEITASYAAIEREFAKTALPADKWYLPAIACFVNHDPVSLKHLYLYLINQPAYATPAARQALIRRIREALFKLVIIVGVCKPLEAIIAIAEVEREEDRDYSCSREDWQNDEANMERSMGWFSKVYQQNLTGTLDLFAAHKDFAWLSKVITYGMFLSDRQSLVDDVDTQLLVLPGIASQNLPNESRWHIRGTLRIGVSKEDVQTVLKITRVIAGVHNVVLNKVPPVEDVLDEV